MYPEIHIGPLTLQTFGIMFALGFIAAGALIAKRLPEIGKSADWAYEMCFAALVGEWSARASTTWSRITTRSATT